MAKNSRDAFIVCNRKIFCLQEGTSGKSKGPPQTRLQRRDWVTILTIRGHGPFTGLKSTQDRRKNKGVILLVVQPVRLIMSPNRLLLRLLGKT